MDPRALSFNVAGTDPAKVSRASRGDYAGFKRCCWFLGLIVFVYCMGHLLCWTGWATGSLWWLRGTRAAYSGTYMVGLIRGRLPAAGARSCGLYAQVAYPISEDADEFADQWFPYMRDEVKPRYFSDHPCLGEALLGDESRGPLARQGLPLASSDGGWPIVIYSSGLRGSVEFYQQFGMDMASTGKIVINLEHEDGAGSYAQDCEGNDIWERKREDPYEDWDDFRSWWRISLETRKAEYNATILAIRETLSTDIPEPNPIEQVLQTGSLDKMMLTGHSFGGCSAFYYMSYLAQERIPTPLIGAILLDLWSDPLSEANYSTPIQEPLVMITSDRWASSSLTINQIMQINGANALAGVQVVGTTHDWISENHLFMWPWVERNLPTWDHAMGPADYLTAFGDTMHVVKETQAAFLNPTLQAALNATVLAIDPDVVIHIWDGVSEPDS